MSESRPLILVIEDDPPIRRFLRASLANHEYDVAERVLGVMRDADGAIGGDPLMFLRVFAVGRVGHFRFSLLAYRCSLFAFRCSSWTFIERGRYHLCVHALSTDLDFYNRSYRGLPGRNVG